MTSHNMPQTHARTESLKQPIKLLLTDIHMILAASLLNVMRKL